MYVHPDRELLRVRQFVSRQTRYVANRLTSDKTKETGRMLCKFALSNPVLVFDTFLGQLQNTDNLIPPFLESCKTLGPLQVCTDDKNICNGRVK